MQHNNPFLNKSTGTDWQILGELELPVGSMADATINTWLTKTLNALNLQSDLLNKVLKSAQDAVARANQPAGAAFESGHIQLIIHAPLIRELDGKTWGFFRIEKLDSKDQEKEHSHHEVEFYLYMEGQ